MSYICSQIADLTNITPICDVPLGLEDELILIPRSSVDWSALKYDAVNKNVINELALKDTKKGAFVFALKKPFQSSTKSLKSGDFRNYITKNLSFNVYSNDEKSAQNVDSLLNGEFVAILKQKYKGSADLALVDGGATYIVWGLDEGLTISALDQDFYSDSIGNGYSITLTEENGVRAEYFLLAKDGDEYSVEKTDLLFESLADR